MRDRGRGGARGRNKHPEPREVTISKRMSYLLRHGSRSEGIEQDMGGWVNVKDLLEWRDLKSQKVTLADIRTVVATNDKSRFTMEPLPPPPLPLSAAGRPMSPSTNATLIPSDPSSSTDPSQFRIRAAQGHSRKDLDRSQLHKEILETDEDCPYVVVHGTNRSNWEKIKTSGGLKPMNRSEIHFARNLVKNLAPLKPGDDKANFVRVPQDDDVISGMRRDSTVCIWVDVRASLRGGVKWWRSTNNVYLTEGINGLLGMEWIVWTERRGGEEVYWGDRDRGLLMLDKQKKDDAKAAQAPGGVLPVDGLAELDVRDEDEAVRKGKKTKFEELVKENWDDSREVSPER